MIHYEQIKQTKNKEKRKTRTSAIYVKFDL